MEELIELIIDEDEDMWEVDDEDDLLFVDPDSLHTFTADCCGDSTGVCC